MELFEIPKNKPLFIVGVVLLVLLFCCCCGVVALATLEPVLNSTRGF